MLIMLLMIQKLVVPCVLSTWHRFNRLCSWAVGIVAFLLFLFS